MNGKLTLAASRRFGAGSLTAVALLVCAVGCGSSNGEATVGRSGSAPTAAPRVERRTHAIARPQPEQRRAFALLRGAPEPLPARIRRYTRPPAAGANLLLAQRIRVSLADAYWLVPADGYLCIVRLRAADEAAVTVCLATGQALRHGVAMTTLTSTGNVPARLIVGVAPDGAARTRLYTGRSVSTAPIEQTIFVLRDSLADPPDHIDMQ